MRKRRKISKKEKNNGWLENFRKELVSLFNVRVISTYISGSWSSRSVGGWKKLTLTKRVNRIIKDTAKSESTLLQKNHPLRKCMKKVKFVELKRVYENKYPSHKEKLNRDVLEVEMIHIFYEKRTPLEKRDDEKKNIGSLDDFYEAFRFLNLCDVTVPYDVIKVVYEYLPRNLDMLLKMSLNKSFYFSFLSSWPHIKAKKENLYQISLLVLHNVKSITIETSSLKENDRKYLWSKLDHQSLSEIKVEGKGHCNEIINSIERYSKKEEDHPFKNIVTLDFHKSNYENVDYGCFLGSDFKTIFPKLRNIIGIHSFNSSKLLQNDHVRHLGFTFLENMKRKNNNVFDFITKITLTHLLYSSLVYCSKNDGNFISPPSLPNFLSSFPSLTSLSFVKFFVELPLYSSTTSSRRRNSFAFGANILHSLTGGRARNSESNEYCFEFSFLSGFKRLQTFRLGSTSGTSGSRTRSYSEIIKKLPYVVRYDMSNGLDKLQKLEIYGKSSKYDFNLADIVDHILTSPNFPSLSSFTGRDLPLIPQRKKEQRDSRFITGAICRFIDMMKSQLGEKYSFVDIEVFGKLEPGYDRLRFLYDSKWSRMKCYCEILGTRKTLISSARLYDGDLTNKEKMSDYVWINKTPNLLTLSLVIREVVVCLGKKNLLNLSWFSEGEKRFPGLAKLMKNVLDNVEVLKRMFVFEEEEKDGCFFVKKSLIQ